MDIWLRGCGKNSNTCKHNYVGTTDSKGKFHRTHLSGDQTKIGTLGPHGIVVKIGDKQYQGVWDTNKGQSGAVTVAGTGALKGYNAEVTGNGGGTSLASGEIKSTNGSNVTQGLFNVLVSSGSGYDANAGTDAIDIFHPLAMFRGDTHFRGHSSGDSNETPSTHIIINLNQSSPVNEFHVDSAYPYDSFHDWLRHGECALHLCGQ
jgi:hypothetical protein